jgi:undecaprenyl-diphosphatase
LAEIDILHAIVLGIVQGLTEWLPISSSGHLALVQLAMDLKVPIFYDVILHIGTLVGVFAIYRRDIAGILRSTVAFGKGSSKRKSIEEEGGGEEEVAKYPQGRRMLWLIILGTIPTGIIGLAFRSFFESSFYDPVSIAVGFIITVALVLVTGLLKPGQKKLGSADAILIGIGQGISIFSSISRSGATLSAGLFRGVEREQLVRYSFLLSIPAILGAAAIDVVAMDEQQKAQLASIGAESYIAGTIVSAAVGYASIRILIKLVIKGKFYLFAFYCFAIGVATLLLL